MCRLREPVHYHPYRIMSLQCPWQVGHKIHRDVLPLPLSYLQWLKQPCWLLVLSLYLLTRETSSNKVPYLSLHSPLVVLTTKILVHLRATWMHGKSRAMKLPENLLSQIGQLGNHYPSSIPKTTICVDDPALVTCSCLYSVLDGHYLCVLPLGLNHSAQQRRCSY